MIGSRGVDWHTQTFGSKDYLAAGELRPIFVRIVNEDLTESAQAIACPTLLLWGTDDTETPPWLARRYWELIGARATLDWLPHKDHHLYTGTGAHLCGVSRSASWDDSASAMRELLALGADPRRRAHVPGVAARCSPTCATSSRKATSTCASCGGRTFAR